MNTIPLVGANLKGFIRNIKSIILLVIFPLLLITVVFLSFNPQGLTKIPAGLVKSDFQEISKFKESATFLSITEYDSLDVCLSELKLFREYLCIDPKIEGILLLRVYYDNTKEPVIWEVIEKTSTAVDLMQEQKSKQMAGDVLSRFRLVGEKIDIYKNSLSEVSGIINKYNIETDSAIYELRNAKDDLGSSMDSMEEDINSIESAENEAKTIKNSYYYEALNKLDYVESYSSMINVNGTDSFYLSEVRSGTRDAKGELISYNNDAESSFRTLDRKISNYKETNRKGKTYISKIDQSIVDLNQKKKDLQSYRSKLELAGNELNTLRSSMQDIDSLNADMLVSPIIVINEPTYIPDPGKFNNNKTDTMTAFNLISLQTIFPQMLLLIVMFLSLLISSFIALNEINSPANVRVSIINGIFIHEFLSTFISSFILVSLPIMIVLSVGQWLFRLHIMQNIMGVGLIIFLLCSTFIFIGMFVAYLIKDESMSLVITTFLILFLIFFSGYLLPVERMSNGAKIIAENSPGKITLLAFNKLVFYSQSLQNINIETYSLSVWFLLAAGSTLILKRLKNY